jgi:Domain of unknown function (DUF4177)
MEYKVVIYREGILGNIFLAGSKVDPVRFTNFLNVNAREGWIVKAMESEIRRTLLFFKREAFIVILERPVQGGAHG